MRFIKDLSDQDKEALSEGFRHGSSSSFRIRCQAILLSCEGKQIKELVTLYGVDRNTVCNWFNRWDSGGISALHDKAKPGRPPKLQTTNTEHVKRVKELVAKESQKLDQVCEQLAKEFSLEISRKTLKRFLKSLVTDGNVLEHQQRNSRTPRITPRNSSD